MIAICFLCFDEQILCIFFIIFCIDQVHESLHSELCISNSNQKVQFHSLNYMQFINRNSILGSEDNIK